MLLVEESSLASGMVLGSDSVSKLWSNHCADAMLRRPFAGTWNRAQIPLE